MSDSTDAALVRNCREGDGAAFDELVRRHREHALATARRAVGDDDAAEDLVQEAFLSAFRALEDLRDGAKFGPWLGSILRRIVHRHWAGERAGQMTVSLVGTELTIAAPEPDEGVLDLQERVQASLRELTRLQRQMIELYYLEGLTCREIAQRLSVPEGTVKRRLHDSRDSLRREWTKMTRAEGVSATGRRLSAWEWGTGSGEARRGLQTLLAQSVVLAINKEAKTAEQVAREVGADVSYVRDVLADLEARELVRRSRGDRYRCGFIALELADHHSLRQHLREVGTALAQRLVPEIPRVRAVYESTVVSHRGWDWDSAQWSIVTMLFCNLALRKHSPEVFDLEPPERADGGRYWVVGSEAPGPFGYDLPELWATGCNSNTFPGGGSSHFWTPQVKKASRRPLGQESLGIIRVLAPRARPVGEVIEQACAGDGPDAEAKTRDVLARMVEAGYVERSDSQTRLLFPVYEQADFDAIAATVDAATATPARELLVPGALALDAKVAALGYGDLADQMPGVRGSLASEILGWTLTAVHAQGGLPDPPQEAPATFGFFAWLGVNPYFGPPDPGAGPFGSPGS